MRYRQSGDADEQTVRKSTAQLINTQRSDDGWAQTTDMSDAYATGTVPNHRSSERNSPKCRGQIDLAHEATIGLSPRRRRATARFR